MVNINDYDKASRRACKDDPSRHFEWLLPVLQAQKPFQEWFDARQLPFPGERDRYCDTVAIFQSPNSEEPPCHVVMEALSEPQGLMLAHMFHYASGLYLELENRAQRYGQTNVALVVLDLTGPPQNDQILCPLPGTEGGLIHIKVVRKCFREEDAAALLARIEKDELGRCLLPWIPLMKGADRSDIIEQWKRCGDLEPDDHRRGRYKNLAMVFSELANRFEIWKQGLEDWNVKQSTVANEWRAEGIAVGLHKGILNLLEFRFHTLPPEIVDRIKTTQDVDRLSSWIDLAMTAASLDDFQAAMEE